MMGAIVMINAVKPRNAIFAKITLLLLTSKLLVLYPMECGYVKAVRRARVA